MYIHIYIHNFTYPICTFLTRYRCLPLEHTNHRNTSMNAALAGHYTNIRIHGMHSNMNPAQPWSTVKAAIAAKSFFSFSSTCYYFGESLTDALGSEAPPLGLIHTAQGGTTIEQWLRNSTTMQCRDTYTPSGVLHYERVVPYLGMAIKGWVWFQGEQDSGDFHGNSAQGFGYGSSCARPVLVRSCFCL